MSTESSSRLKTPLLRPVLAATAAIACLAGTAGASAQVSSPADLRGYNSCVKAFDTNELNGVHFPRVYYIARNADAANAGSKTYYVNASAWQDGNRVMKRLSCTTTRSGRQVLAFEAQDGRYALSGNQRLNVARR